jgi:NAD-dependent dihydropyrimidine dehydrogenase PreA subunit
MKTTTTATRKIVKIDPDKCDGCGACVPNCAEGAIRIIDGKARLVADNLCDGLGNCLGKCPRDAITIEERPAAEFDEQAVHAETQRGGSLGSSCGAGILLAAASGTPAPQAETHSPHFGGCPGRMMRTLQPKAATAAAPGAAPVAGAAGAHAAAAAPVSRLGHWPVQLTLLPMAGAIWQDADVLIAADCVAFAMPDFHERLLAGRSLAVGCPKLDDVAAYTEKLTAIFAANRVRSVTVAHMEVPCCWGIVQAVQTALERSGRTDIAYAEVTVGVDGKIME